ncbi:MAG: PorT protein [Bacteroidetes bacterium OLB9]|nr:MAG: PorT protein [Bacteroidetes bacterium OLB9]
MVTNLKIGDYFDFRFLPGFSFAQRGFEYTPVADGKTYTRKVESVFFELPFHLRFKSDPYKDKRMFVVAGLKYSYDVQSNSKSRKSLIKIAPHDFQYEVGVGMQMFYPYFIFSPEIKFSRGLGNILLYDRTKNEARILENVVSQIFTISFNFEG